MRHRVGAIFVGVSIATSVGSAPNAFAQDQSIAKVEFVEAKAAPELRPKGGPTQPASLNDAPMEKSLGSQTGHRDHEGSRAAPPNDDCTGAQAITGTGAFAFDNAEATQDGQSHFFCNFFGESQIAHDVWFKWTAPITANFIVDTCQGTSIDTKLAVYTNSPCPPGDAALISCNDESCSLQSRVSFSAIAGQLYLIRVGTYPGAAGGAGTLQIQFQSGQNLCNQLAANCQTRDNSNGFDSTGRIVKDDFRVGQDTTLTKLCFWGGYFSTSGGCATIPADHFVVTYYDDAGGSPGFPIASFIQGVDFVLSGPVPTGSTINGAANEYAYTVTHPAVQVFADTCYWVEITNELQGGSCAWYWEKGNSGNGAALQDSTVIASDLAFCLNTPRAQASLCQAPGPPSNDSCAGAMQLFNFDTVVAQNLFATTSPSDPPFACRTGGAAQGIGTLWYKFVATASTARITTCGTGSGDSLIALYSGSCGGLTPIDCNDDFCGFRSQICAAGLTQGQTYYVEFAVYDDSRRGPYNLSLAMPCPLPPSNDLCSGAITVSYSGGFGAFAGTTAFATTDAGAPACALSPIAAPGVWLKVIGNGETLTASLCPSEYDTKLNVYCGSCTQLTCVGHNDDSCEEQSSVTWCSEAGRTYYLLIFGFNGAVGDYTLFLTSDGVACSPYPACTTCTIPCPQGAIAENEACSGDANGGCNDPGDAVQHIQPNQTICGTASMTGLTRDTDWFEFTIDSASVVVWSVQAELPVELYILGSVCSPEPFVYAHATVAQCGSGTATAELEPGTYRTFVGNIGDGYPCGASNTYVATLTSTPIGACCTTSDCIRTTQADCASLNGQYGGNNSSCPTTYSLSTCASAFEDISATGTAVAFSSDEDARQAPIGFTFRFFGVNATSLTIAADGYLSLLSAAASIPLNTALPDPGAPNGIIAPLWDDLAPASGGSVRYQTLGSAPDRRLIVQWKQVPQFLVGDANTFQAVLFEGSNCIEFRYGPITPQAATGDYTIGVENQFGSRATQANAAMVAQGTCLRFCPMISPGACAPPGCAGDANHDGRTNFTDLTSVLANWGASGPPGDATLDGQVNFADVTNVLANFGCAPQACPGDANHDNAVSFADISSVLANFGGTGATGDANGDGQVNFADITNVLVNFGVICLP